LAEAAWELSMSMSSAGRESAWREFLRLWDRIQTDSLDPGTVFLVEGERDRVALRRLGIRAPIQLVHCGRSLSEVALELSESGRHVVVLTDWDSEGGQLAYRFRSLLHDGRLTLDFDTRRRLAHALRGEVVHVEGLAHWANRMAERAGAPLDHWLPALAE
jgi:5S rRNA maturation endonuclease (ribonuclease M5)